MIEALTVCVPKDTVDRSHINPEDLAKFERVTGIKKTRRFENTTGLMIEEAIDSIRRFWPVFDAIVVITQCPDEFSPCLATRIHDYLKQPPTTLAIDLNHACDGWLAGLHMCERLPGRTLMICADRLRYGEGTEGLIFSDSVSFTEVRSGRDISAMFFTDGSNRHMLISELDGNMTMDGNFIFDFVTSKVPDLIKQYPYQGQWLVPHQANLSMNKIVEMRSGYKDRALYSIEEYGNLSMNSIPMTIAHNEEKIMGDRILCCGFGAGITVTTKAMDWPNLRITKIQEF